MSKFRFGFCWVVACMDDRTLACAHGQYSFFLRITFFACMSVATYMYTLKEDICKLFHPLNECRLVIACGHQIIER